MLDTPRQLLRAHLLTNKLSVAQFAAKLRISRVYLYKLLDERPGCGKTPGLDLAVRIESEAGVPVSSWANPTGKTSTKRRTA